MNIVVHLTNLSHLYDYLDMGVDYYVIGGPMSAFSMPQFSLDEIKEVSQKVPHLFVLLNGLYEEHELSEVHKLIDSYTEMGVETLLFQDMSVLQYVKKSKLIGLMYAPQTLNTNKYSLEVLKKYGVTSAFLSKEIPLKEQLQMTGAMPLMMQAHGVQYMASSRRHLLRNYYEYYDKEVKKDIILHPRESDYDTHVYEDERGTTFYSVKKLYTLDLFHHLEKFEYLYIETMYMSDIEMIEVVSIYNDCVRSFYSGNYDHDVKEYLPLLRRVSTPLERGFLSEQTIYTLEDIKERDNNEKR